MFIYSLEKSGQDIKRCSTKSQRTREIQDAVNKLPKKTILLVHLGVYKDGVDELCEGKNFTSK